MNEMELLRNQLSTERRHVREVASACAAAHRDALQAADGATLDALRAASREYLGCVLGWFDERDARLGELRGPSSSGREALERLGRDGGTREGWQALAQFIDGPWEARRRAAEALLAANPRVTDWRAFACLDADSIYRERALYARFRAALPPGAAAGPA